VAAVTRAVAGAFPEVAAGAARALHIEVGWHPVHEGGETFSASYAASQGLTEGGVRMAYPALLSVQLVGARLAMVQGKSGIAGWAATRGLGSDGRLRKTRPMGGVRRRAWL